jgi:putative tricarboxylic transport membrane protein
LSEEPREQREPESGAQTAPQLSFLGPRIFAVAILAFGLFVLYGTFQISNKQGFSPDGPRFFPLIVAVGLLVFGTLFLLSTTLRRDRYLGEKAAAEEATTDWPTTGMVAAILVVYAFLLNPLGYIIATALLFPAVSYVLGSRGRRKVLRNLAIGIALGVLVFFSFTELLGVRLPDGILDPLL